MDRTNDQHIYSEFLTRNKYTIINCESCGYWHVHPMPSVEELNEYYQKSYYENLGDNRSQTDKLHDPDGFYHIQYEDKLRRIMKLLPNNSPLKVLDIGAGYGDFLRFMKENGWETMGIEPSAEALEGCKEEDLGIHCAPFAELLRLGFPHCSLVTLNSVLEHLPNPIEVLESVRDYLLLPDGVLHIGVPNDFSFLQMLLNNTVLRENGPKQSYWVHPPDHLNYWTHRSLKTVVTRLGFIVLRCFSTFPLELFPLMGEDYITNPEIGRAMHLKRVSLEKHLHETKNGKFKDLLYGKFARLGIGREIELFATIR